MIPPKPGHCFPWRWLVLMKDGHDGEGFLRIANCTYSVTEKRINRDDGTTGSEFSLTTARGKVHRLREVAAGGNQLICDCPAGAGCTLIVAAREALREPREVSRFPKRFRHDTDQTPPVPYVRRRDSGLPAPDAVVISWSDHS